MATRIMPPQEFLREALDYDTETGALTWRVRPRHHFTSDGQHRRWNKLYSCKNAINSRHHFGEFWNPG